MRAERLAWRTAVSFLAALTLMLVLAFTAAGCDGPPEAPETADPPPTPTPTNPASPTATPAPTPAAVPTATPTPTPAEAEVHRLITRPPTPATAPAETPTPTDDLVALLALYHATDGERWANNTNWLSEAPLGTWHGVATDSRGRVTRLDLSTNQLRGTIPPALGRLHNLDFLALAENQLRGRSLANWAVCPGWNF